MLGDLRPQTLKVCKTKALVAKTLRNPWEACLVEDLLDHTLVGCIWNPQPQADDGLGASTRLSDFLRDHGQRLGCLPTRPKPLKAEALAACPPDSAKSMDRRMVAKMQKQQQWKWQLPREAKQPQPQEAKQPQQLKRTQQTATKAVVTTAATLVKNELLLLRCNVNSRNCHLYLRQDRLTGDNSWSHTTKMSASVYDMLSGFAAMTLCNATAATTTTIYWDDY